MYITQEIANKIKSLAKEQQVQLKTMLSDCNLGINSISEFSKGKELSCISLAKLADYLGCSIDYLLGRTSDPQAHKNSNSMPVENVSGKNGIAGNVVSGSINNTAINPQTEALLDTFNKLTTVEQAKVLVYADELSKSK